MKNIRIRYMILDIGKIKKYAIIRFTSTKLKYFDLSINKIQFCNDFAENVQVFLINDINGKSQLHVFSINEMNGMAKQINSIRYKERDN